MGDNVQTVRRLETAWSTEDYSTVREILAPDFPEHNHGAGAEAMPPGIDGLIEGHKMSLGAFPDRKQEIMDSFGDGDRVMIRSRMTGTNKGGLPWFGIPANDRQVDVEYITIYRLEDDKVVESWAQMDIAKMMLQLGMGGDA
jgi:predicted ester cyclase